MIINDTSFGAIGTPIAPKTPAENIDSDRRAQTKESSVKDSSDESKVAPEELLDEIQALTEDGIYSVRFEMNDTTDDMVIKIVDNESDEVIRQMPAEEVLSMKERMSDLRGNIVDITS